MIQNNVIKANVIRCHNTPIAAIGSVGGKKSEYEEYLTADEGAYMTSDGVAYLVKKSTTE